jgi:nicotinamidase-related amidase
MEGNCLKQVALLIVDMQNDFVRRGAHGGRRRHRRYSRYGRSLYLIGSDPRSARITGLPIARITLVTKDNP